MTNKYSSGRKFVGTLATVAATGASSSQAAPEADVSAAQRFVSAWDTAWANHDAAALGAS